MQKGENLKMNVLKTKKEESEGKNEESKSQNFQLKIE